MSLLWHVSAPPTLPHLCKFPHCKGDRTQQDWCLKSTAWLLPVRKGRNIRSGTSSSLFPLQIFLQWVSTWKCFLRHRPQSGDECVFELQSPNEPNNNVCIGHYHFNMDCICAGKVCWAMRTLRPARRPSCPVTKQKEHFDNIIDYFIVVKCRSKSWQCDRCMCTLPGPWRWSSEMEFSHRSF